jgi:hypothetical protein
MLRAGTSLEGEAWPPFNDEPDADHRFAKVLLPTA